MAPASYIPQPQSAEERALVTIAQHRAGVERAEEWAMRDFWRLQFLRNIRYDRDVQTHWLLPIRAFIKRHPWIGVFFGAS